MTIIKKYPNRRLYDTARSAYINLEAVAALVREGEEVQVVDSRDGSDKTREVLLQIVLEVLQGADLLPIGMLRRWIRATGDRPADKILRAQLATGLKLMSAQLDRMEALVAPVRPAQRSAATSPPAPHDPPPKAVDAETAELRERLAALEARLSRASELG